MSNGDGIGDVVKHDNDPTAAYRAEIPPPPTHPPTNFQNWLHKQCNAPHVHHQKPPRKVLVYRQHGDGVKSSTKTQSTDTTRRCTTVRDSEGKAIPCNGGSDGSLQSYSQNRLVRSFVGS